MKHLDTMRTNDKTNLLNRFARDKHRAPFKPGESHLSKFTGDLAATHQNNQSLEKSLDVASEGQKRSFDGINAFNTQHISSYENVPTQASLNKKISGSIIGSSGLGQGSILLASGSLEAGSTDAGFSTQNNNSQVNIHPVLKQAGLDFATPSQASLSKPMSKVSPIRIQNAGETSGLAVTSPTGKTLLPISNMRNPLYKNNVGTLFPMGDRLRRGGSTATDAQFKLFGRNNIACQIKSTKDYPVMQVNAAKRVSVVHRNNAPITKSKSVRPFNK